MNRGRFLAGIVCLTFACFGCGRTPSDANRPGLFKRWSEGVREMKDKSKRTNDVVDFFAYQWNAVAFQTVAEDLLESRLRGETQEAPWPMGKEPRPFGRQERRAREDFVKRFGLSPPPYFPPALDEYSLIKPPWAEGVNRNYWERELRSHGIRTIHDASEFLEKREADQKRRETAGREERALPPKAKAADPLKQQILDLLGEFPGTKLEYLDTGKCYMEIRLNEYLELGTDAACAAVSKLFLDLCSLAEGEFIVRVTSPWVPSLVNPMDVTWARELADLGGAPGLPSIPAADWQKKVHAELIRRGVRRF
jgi:hypothetical protein